MILLCICCKPSELVLLVLVAVWSLFLGQCRHADPTTQASLGYLKKADKFRLSKLSEWRSVSAVID